MSDKGVYGTAPAAPGLLIIIVDELGKLEVYIELWISSSLRCDIFTTLIPKQ